MVHVDEKLGAGSSHMALAMLHAMGHVNDESLAQFVPIDLDLRPRLEMARLRLEFLIHGETVFVLRWTIDDDDPHWSYVAKSGLTSLNHLPSVPIVDPAD